MEQLSATDATFTYMETPNTPLHIGSMAIYDPSTAPNGKVGFKDILRYIEGRLDGAPIFRRKLVHVPLDLDHPYWVEDADFDLEFHVRHIALPKPGDWRQLCIQAARIYSRPLDMTKPLWEFTVIEGLDSVEGVPKGSFAILQKMHHAAMDGQSALQMSLALLDFDAKIKPRKFDRKWEPETQPNPLGLLTKANINNLMNPVRGFQNLQNLLPMPLRIREVRRKFAQPDDAKADVPRTRFNQKVGPHRVFDGRSFSLPDIKTIRNGFPGATVNDVMIAVVSGSMRHYLDSNGELPEQSMKIAVPVSVRDKDDSASGGNQISTMFVGCGSHLADAGARLDFILNETQRSKAMTEAIGAKTLMEVSGAMPAGLMAAGTKMMARSGLMDTMNPIANTVVTNVPGPMTKVYFAGAEAVITYGMGFLAEGQGIFHTVTSYDGNVILTFVADRDAIPDPANYGDMMQKSFDDLLNAAGERVSKQTAKKKTQAKPRKMKTRAKKKGG